MNPRARSIQYIGSYRFLVLLLTDEQKLFDVKPYLVYPVYERLEDELYCARATVQNGIAVWDEETDTDPNRLYLESVPASAALQR